MRVNTAPKTCRHCGVAMLRRRRESLVSWSARQFCGRACKGLARSGDVAAKFWGSVAKGSPDQCWPWQGATTLRGYGQFYARGATWRAHRYAVMLATGRDPGVFVVLHSCDNPICCNPDHLSVGTPADNNADMRAKGRDRQLRGTANSNAKLDEAAVRHIRASTDALSILADRYGANKSTICNARSGKTWAHVL